MTGLLLLLPWLTCRIERTLVVLWVVEGLMAWNDVGAHLLIKSRIINRLADLVRPLKVLEAGVHPSADELPFAGAAVVEQEVGSGLSDAAEA